MSHTISYKDRDGDTYEERHQNIKGPFESMSSCLQLKQFRNKEIRKDLRVTNIEEVMKENRLTWFEHVQIWDINKSVREIERWRLRDIKRSRTTEDDYEVRSV